MQLKNDTFILIVAILEDWHISSGNFDKYIMRYSCEKTYRNMSIYNKRNIDRYNNMNFFIGFDIWKKFRQLLSCKSLATPFSFSSIYILIYIYIYIYMMTICRLLYINWSFQYGCLFILLQESNASFWTFFLLLIDKRRINQRLEPIYMSLYAWSVKIFRSI